MKQVDLTTTESAVDTPETANPLQPFVLDEHRVMVGDMVLDLAMRTIHSRSMRTVKLSGNEFVILATLVKSPGRFVSKEDLLSSVAGNDGDAHHSGIDTYIKDLHRRLQEADTSVTIEKAIDVGFRLCP